jgi:2-polyprenyl-6-methoxyphenol hydroxylase-like FAD-dependent oxidoreductase
MSTERLRVVIVGAGLGGLTLANLLRQCGDRFEITVFERDPSAHARPQGYSISLKDPGGLVSLRRLGLYDEVRTHSSVVERLRILAQSGRELLTLGEDPASPHVSLRVPRMELRDTLLRGLGADAVFGETCTGYTNDDGRPIVTFASGKEMGADLVVGCDGVHSVIRRQMIGDSRHYLGIASVRGRCTKAPPSLDLHGGPVLVLGNGSTLFLLEAGEGVGWSLTRRAPERQFEGLSPPELKEHAVAATRGWAPKFEHVVGESEPSELLSLGGFYDREPLAKARSQGVVLLGDAAHPMSPFRGEGANTAMQDALVLAGVLTKSGADLKATLSSYEREMLARSRKYILLSRKAAREMHSLHWLVQCVRNTKLRSANFFMKRYHPSSSDPG